MIKFSDSHEWIKEDNGIGTVGVTQHAQHELGDIVYVELPKIEFDVKSGDEIAVLESTKAAADVYTPVSGTIIEVNEQLNTDPGLVNQSPQERGWLFKIRLADSKELDSLMDEKAYLEKINQSS